MLIKIPLSSAPDAYSILQGKRDTKLDSLIKQMGSATHLDFHIPHKGKYRIQLFKDQPEPYTRYFTHMIIAIPN